MIKGLSEDMLRCYINMRHKIDTEAKTIQSLASMLSLLQLCGDDKIQIDPVAFGFTQSLIEQSILNIYDLLDDFIYITEARESLEDG